MSVLIVILGLALLIFVHEAGHFLASLAVGLRPRKFYVGFPPALVKVKRNGIEYGIGMVPLGGFVSIPGMHRPIAHDAERRFSAAVSELPPLAGPVDRLKRALDAEDFSGAVEPLEETDLLVRKHQLSPGARAAAEKGVTELGDALGPDAYWKAPTWRRIVAVAAGPIANVLLAFVIFAYLFTQVGGPPSRTVAAVAKDSPAQVAGLLPGDRVVGVDGEEVSGEELGTAILESGGRPLQVTVVRDGERLTLTVTPAMTEDGYRIGIVRGGTGLALPDALWRAVEVTGIATREVVFAVGRLFGGEGTEDIASPIGITRVSLDAIEQGTNQYLFAVALFSLSLALLNLLPLLPLDGGHILFALIEGARGRIVRREVYEKVSFVGIAIVLFLFAIGLTNDIGRLS